MRKTRRWTIASLALLGLVQGPVAGARSPQLGAPLGLPANARRIIRQHMEKHGDAMSRLVWDVILLQYDAAAREATAIADDARPLDRHDPALEELVHVFDLQERLRYRALGVADAARAHDGAALGATFGQLSETCVQCHLAYLDYRPASK